jgi:transcriptional regulator with XRE-family HTH domain
VGTAIREARLARNMTQRELAERLGTSPANVSRWETGAAMPGLDRLGALCEALDVPAEYFTRPRTPTDDG